MGGGKARHTASIADAQEIRQLRHHGGIRVGERVTVLISGRVERCYGLIISYRVRRCSQPGYNGVYKEVLFVVVVAETQGLLGRDQCSEPWTITLPW